MIETFAAYQAQALRTSGKPSLPCWGLGLAGEAAEVSEKIIDSLEDQDGFHGYTPRIEDELGDVLWYATVGSHAIGLTLGELLDLSKDDLDAFQDEMYVLEGIEGMPRRIVLPHLTSRLMIQAGSFADHVKKVAFHGHPLADHQRELEDSLAEVISLVAVIGRVVGRRLSQIATYNVEKLAARYPKGFSTKASLHRRA